MSTKQERKLLIWHRLTPEQRDYDRFVARSIPYGASFAPETEAGRRMRDAMLDRDNSERGCSCHYCAPCSWCVERNDDEAERQDALTKREGT